MRVVSLHLHSADGARLLFPPAVVRLLSAVYERPPVCFQSMSFRHGSQQSDLVHGGAPVTRPGLLRRSFVAHFMPLGARPTFYDASREAIVRYGAGFRLRRESESPTLLRRLARAF